MRRRHLIVAACMLLLAGTSLSQMKIGFGPHVGISFSSFPKPMNEVYGMGFNFGAQGELEFTKNIGLRLGLDYGSFSSDKTKFPYTDGNGKAIPSSDITGLNVGIFGLTVSGVGKLPLKGGFTPYGLIGFGLNFIGASDLVVRVNGQDYPQIKGDSSTKFGLNFGVGGEYRVAKNIGIFGEFKVALIFTEGSSTTVLPLAFGANFWL